MRLLLRLLRLTREGRPPLCLQAERCAEGHRGQAGRVGPVRLPGEQAGENER